MSPRTLPSPRVVVALVVLLCGACSGAACGTAGARPVDVRAAVDAAFRPVIKRYDVPGLAVAVTLDGRRYFINYGLASKARHAPVTKNTLFELGSVSKTFTATLGAYAGAVGKLSLNDHPSRYMPQLRGSALDRATLLHLGTYTAGGLPLQFPDAIADDADMVSYFQHFTPDAAPGAEREYSNPSIGLFGHVAGLALGGDFAGLSGKLLFPQLRLRDTYIKVPAAAMPRYAWGYTADDKPIRVAPGELDAEAYGVKTSATDMLKFVEENLDPSHLGGSMRRAVDATHVGYFKTGDMVQGLGWEQFAFPVSLKQLQAGNSDAIDLKPNPTTPVRSPAPPSPSTLFDKTGSTNGFGSYALFVPQRRVGIVMLANKSFPIPARVSASYALLRRLIKQ